MTNNHTITVSVSDETQKVLDDLGISLSDTVNIILERIGNEGRMPFNYPEEDFEIEISSDEILQKLEEAEEDFRQGRSMTLEQFKENVRRHIDELRS